MPNNNNNESGLVTKAINILRETRTGTVAPFDINKQCPVTVVINRVDWEKWFLDEQTRTFCTFYYRTGGDARAKNDAFINKFGPHDQPHDDNANQQVEHVGKKRGRPTVLNFHQVYVCHRSGAPKQYVRNLERAPLGCNCTSTIKVHCYGDNPLKMHIEYNWQHTGHDLGSSADMQSIPAGRSARQLIEAMIDEEMTWKSISHAIRVDRAELERIKMSNYKQLPAIKKISYDMVYYAMRRAIKRRSQLGRSLRESLEKWGEKISSEEGAYHYNNNMNDI
ncbi:hypothetical protein INT45_013569 [Circinella minor]|uniref:Uncharacterized protein n=1 Tax=Circinella minor TaxID=1195481 RepID=A0A8H7VDM5_9FUNG|nr:hypothetical protein INT45_013569 [Circinella minor]